MRRATHPSRAFGFALVGLGFVANVAVCQATTHSKKPSLAELKQRYEKKLEAPWIAKGKWVLDYDEARRRAKREGKLIFAYFSRSYSY